MQTLIFVNTSQLKSFSVTCLIKQLTALKKKGFKYTWWNITLTTIKGKTVYCHASFKYRYVNWFNETGLNEKLLSFKT